MCERPELCKMMQQSLRSVADIDGQVSQSWERRRDQSEVKTGGSKVQSRNRVVRFLQQDNSLSDVSESCTRGGRYGKGICACEGPKTACGK